MSASTQAHERIDLRTSPEIKELIVRAATTAGMSVSAFFLGTAQERARQILAETEMMTLSAKDWNAFAKALDNADKPRPKLSAAMQRHRDWQRASVDLELLGTIDPFSSDHDRRSFTCGVDALDEYLRRFARQHATANISRTYVAVARRFVGITVSPCPEFAGKTCRPGTLIAFRTFRYQSPAWLDWLWQYVISAKDSANCYWRTRFNVACVCLTR